MLFLRPVRASIGGPLGAILAAVSVVGVSAPAAACGASGEVSGGDPIYDGSGGSVGSAPVLVADGGEGGTTVTSHVLSCGGNDAGTGSTWTDLYRDYFGTAGGASCAGTGTACHADANSAGTQGSGGFICGSDQATCFAGMTMGTADMVVSADAKDPTNSGLENALRKQTASGSNNMPLEPTLCVFTDADIVRISAWIAAGAPNN